MMIKRKELKGTEKSSSDPLKELAAMDKELLVDEEEDIIELDEVIEEGESPDLLPVGNDLDELLKSSEDNDDDLDLEKLDMELGFDDDENKALVDEAEDVPAASGKKPPLSPQDSIDDLFEEALTETDSQKPMVETFLAEETGAIQTEPEKPEESAVQTYQPSLDLDPIVEALEIRLIAKFEEIVERRLPELVVQTVRQELKNLIDEYEKS